MQAAFWTSTHWLAVGSLVALRNPTAQAHDSPIVFVEVTGRDVNMLKTMQTRARVRVRFLNQKDALVVMATYAKTRAELTRDRGWCAETPASGPQPVHAAFTDAVQLSGNFSVSRTVLEALQSQRLAHPPFADALFGGKHSVQPPALPVPPWQRDADAAAWIQPQLNRMDAAQRTAFDAMLSRPVSLVQGPPGAQHAQSATVLCLSWLRLAYKC